MADSPVNDSFNESYDGSKDTNESSHTSSHFASSFGNQKALTDELDHRPSVNLYSRQQYLGNKDSQDEENSDEEEEEKSPRRSQFLVQQSTILKKSYGDDDYEDEDGASSASRTSAINRQESGSGVKFDATKYKQSTEDLGDEYHHVEHRHVEFEDDEEAISSPAAASSLQNSFKLETKKSVETDEALQFKFTTNYQMSEREFKAQKSFFDRIQGGGRASFKLVFILLAQQLRKRGIQGNEEDVNRVVQLMDADDDGLITFNEFVDLLQLFFAKPSNVGARVEMILNNRSFTNLKSYSLSPDEARSFLNFLDEFYGAPAGTSSSLRIRPELNERISNAKFAELVAPIYSQLTFLL